MSGLLAEAGPDQSHCLVVKSFHEKYFCCRNKDFQEVTLEKDGQVLLCFASTYGFRNIQNLVQKLKRGKSPYDFVEVMACPSGKMVYFFEYPIFQKWYFPGY